MTARKKFTLITIFSVIGVLVIGSLITALVWAAEQAKLKLNADVTVTFKANEVNATVSANYISEGTRTSLKAGGKTEIKLTDSETTSVAFENPNAEGYILNSGDEFYLEYVFTNDYKEKDILVQLDNDVQPTVENIKREYAYLYEAVSDDNLSATLSSLTFSTTPRSMVILGRDDVTSTDSKLADDYILTVYVRISANNPEEDASYAGAMGWVLEKPETEGVKISYSNVDSSANPYHLYRYFVNGETVEVSNLVSPSFADNKIFKTWRNAGGDVITSFNATAGYSLTADVSSFTVTDNGDNTYTLSSYSKTAPAGKNEVVVIPDTASDGKAITKLGAGLFKGVTNITSVRLPNNLVSIPDNAFNACTGLTTVNIPASVEYIGKYAFYNTSLNAINFPADSKLKYIGEWAFSSTTMTADTVVLPETVTGIAGNSFRGGNIKNLTLSRSLSNSSETTDYLEFTDNSIKLMAGLETITFVGKDSLSIDGLDYNSVISKIATEKTLSIIIQYDSRLTGESESEIKSLAEGKFSNYIAKLTYVDVNPNVN